MVVMIRKEQLLTFFRDKVTRPLSFREIVFQLSLTPPERRILKRTLREMVSEGTVIRTRKGLYGPPEEMGLVTGYFEVHKEGYGFVISEEPGSRDVFIPARSTLGAMDNDRVVARLENRGRRDGQIIRVLERAHARVVGTLQRDKSAWYVRPKGRSTLSDIHVGPDDRGKAQVGDRVIAEIITYPSDKRSSAGRIVKVLEKPESPKSEVESIIDESNLPRRFPHGVLEEARALYAVPSTKLIARKRRDLRDLPTVTIDGERARDFDDAVSIKKTNNGYTLWVHIADVGHYVKWDTPIDKEARKRGTSVYFPDRVIPMLPKELSEELCSLKPGADRRAFTVEMAFNGRGERVHELFYPSIIQSDERMTYTSVRKILIDRSPEERMKYEYLLHDLEVMGELCNVIKERRLEKGSLDFDLPEPEVLLDIQGNPETVIRAERNFAHMMIEEFMVAANEAVAEYLETTGVPTLFRIHEEPDPVKLKDIVRIIGSLGILKGKRDLKPKDFSGLIRKVRGLPEEGILHYMILRSLKQARYSTTNVGHFGLASNSYTHFTSPIRRYPDLVVHRILREILAKKELSDKRQKELESILPDIAFHSSRMERQSDDAEKAVVNAMRVWFMKDKIGEEFEGKIVSVTPFGLKVRLEDFYVEGFLHVSYMTDDFYQYNEKNLSLYGIHKRKRFTIGKGLKVRIDTIDMEEREIVLGM